MNKESTEKNIITKLKSVEKYLESVEEEFEKLTERGFVVHKEFLDEDKYPLITKQLRKYITPMGGDSYSDVLWRGINSIERDSLLLDLNFLKSHLEYTNVNNMDLKSLNDFNLLFLLK
jgi:hypothetical protein